jgi:ankyrin repeat protein
MKSVTKNVWKALDSAADKGHVEVVRQLLKNGACIESATNNGWTTLTSAASESQVEVL